MVRTEIDELNGEGMIVLTPNNSATWRYNMLVTLSLAIIMFIISSYFLYQGLWLIMPFSGLEVLVLIAVLYHITSRNIRTEIIIFDRDTVRIERGRREIEDRFEYQRAWSRIFIQPPEHHGHMKRIFIRSYGKELELGEFLNQPDREVFIRSLKHLVYS